MAGQAGLIFTAGACPLDEQGQVVAPGDVSAQMRQALGNLRTALQEFLPEGKVLLETSLQNLLPLPGSVITVLNWQRRKRIGMSVNITIVYFG